MENSDLQTKIINLGKLLVKELNLDPGVDTLSKWMAHYIAEKITVAENSLGIEKQTAEKECFDVILKLWNHRNNLPPGKKPIEAFEPILELLEKINPDNDHDHYNRIILNRDFSALNDTEVLDTDAIKWMNITKEIDRVARIWIEYALIKASENLKTEKTEEWLKTTEKMSERKDFDVVEIIINLDSTVDSSEEDSLKKYRLEKLDKRIKELEKFSKLNELILNSYKIELEQQ